MDDDSAKQKGLLLFICLGIVTCVGRFVQTADDLNARLVCESNAVVAVEDPARLFGRPSLPGLLCHSTYLILTYTSYCLHELGGRQLVRSKQFSAQHNPCPRPNDPRHIMSLLGGSNRIYLTLHAMSSYLQPTSYIYLGTCECTLLQ